MCNLESPHQGAEGEEVKSELIRMRKIGEGIGYIRMAKHARIQAEWHMKQAKTLHVVAGALLAKADKCMGLTAEKK